MALVIENAIFFNQTFQFFESQVLILLFCLFWARLSTVCFLFLSTFLKLDIFLPLSHPNSSLPVLVISVVDLNTLGCIKHWYLGLKLIPWMLQNRLVRTKACVLESLGYFFLLSIRPCSFSVIIFDKLNSVHLISSEVLSIILTWAQLLINYLSQIDLLELSYLFIFKRFILSWGGFFALLRGRIVSIKQDIREKLHSKWVICIGFRLAINQPHNLDLYRQ